ncbi:hypothetical protein BTVI_109898 [Pitangus sulphuratus]|nr:hypothetical protein BTVI_109898 [Pitangus sulphuratus]
MALIEFGFFGDGRVNGTTEKNQDIEERTVGSTHVCCKVQHYLTVEGFFSSKEVRLLFWMNVLEVTVEALERLATMKDQTLDSDQKRYGDFLDGSN